MSNENPKPGSTKRHLVKSAGLMSIMTLFSRLLGLARDIVCAKTFGTSWQWDAFLYAFLFPNFFRRIIGEGALSSAFIPVYSQTLSSQGQDEAFRFANVVFTGMCAGFLVLLFILEGVFHMLLGLPELSPTLRLTFDLLRVLFPYLLFICLFALGMGILNSHRHFFAPSLGPLVLNIVWIAGVIWLVPHAGPDLADQTRWLAYALLVAGFFQVAVELPSLHRMGFRLKWIWDFMCPAFRKTMQLLMPVAVGFAVVQVNILVDMSLALGLGPGANSSLWYGTRLMHFPVGVFAIAMGTALLPTISEQMAKKDLEATARSVSFALRSVFLIILPCSVGFILLSSPIVHMLFERGQFDAESTTRSAGVLVGYSIGLFAYSGSRIVVAGFHAAQDTKTPVKIAVIAMTANLVFDLILMRFFAEAGLAMATSVAGILHFFLLIAFYNRNIVKIDLGRIFRALLKILLASLCMGGFCLAVYSLGGRVLGDAHISHILLRVLGTITFSAFAYVGFCLIFKIREMQQAWEWMRNRRKS
ncbi:MAG: murein biosynthesis integral membrane protein MurJ [Candidatus Omnitrophota bacterium]|nr:murein biosynthesis integral membrane protein MurJ [Candidatus Omnitrophota bacterium]